MEGHIFEQIYNKMGIVASYSFFLDSCLFLKIINFRYYKVIIFHEIDRFVYFMHSAKDIYQRIGSQQCFSYENNDNDLSLPTTPKTLINAIFILEILIFEVPILQFLSVCEENNAAQMFQNQLSRKIGRNFMG